MESAYKKKSFLWVIFIIWLLIFSLRILNLDADLPNWGMTHYTPIDEGSYSLMALNKYDFGKVDPSELFDGEAPYVAPQLRNNLIGNVVTYITLILLGDNYFGLRMPSVIYALLLFLEIGWGLNYLRKKYGSARTDFPYLILLLFVLVFDFDLLVSSRVCENSLLRACFALGTVITYFKFSKGTAIKRYFFSTFLATISVFLVYITNAFLGLAIAFAFIMDCFILKKESWKRASVGCIVGGSLALLLSELYYYVVWRTFAITNSVQVIKAFVSANMFDNYERVSSFSMLYQRFASIVSSDIILYNLPLFFLFMLLLVNILKQIYRIKDMDLLYIVFVVVAFVIQTFFSEDQVIKKIIVIYPCFILLLYLGLMYSNERTSQKIRTNIFYSLYVILTYYIVYKIYAKRRFGMHDNTNLDFEEIDFEFLKWIVIVLGFVTIFTLISICIKKSKKYYKEIVLGLIWMTILVNVSFAYKYVYSDPVFSEKEVMQELGRIVGDDYVIGEYANGYRLYNDVKSVPLSSYENLKKFIEEHPDFWYFDYYFPFYECEGYFNAIPLKESQYTGVPYKSFKRNYKTYGKKRAVCLYTIQKKQ